MSRRPATGDQEFGSDSFLDIIANIVGILIILIVVAGVKVARQPADSTATAVAGPVAAATVPTLPTNQPLKESVIAATVDHTPRGPEQRVVAALPEIDAEALEDLERDIADLRLQLEGFSSTVAASETELQQLLEETEAAERQLADNAVHLQEIGTERDDASERVLRLSRSLGRDEDAVATAGQQLSASERHQEFIADRLQAVSVETQQLQEVLDTAQAASDNADRIQHRMAPVSEPVTDHELHFRISHGRIAHIPLEALLERLKAQLAIRRSTIMRMKRYEGTVGPVGGFRLQYTVERSALSPLQSLQYGNQAFRVAVSRWTVMPAETLIAERIDEAAVIGSRFRQVLETAPQDSTITVWLYPEDFGAFRQVRELAHGLHLRVAARPLPPGTPIAGSPGGSRSSGQ